MESSSFVIVWSIWMHRGMLKEFIFPSLVGRTSNRIQIQRYSQNTSTPTRLNLLQDRPPPANETLSGCSTDDVSTARSLYQSRLLYPHNSWVTYQIVRNRRKSMYVPSGLPSWAQDKQVLTGPLVSCELIQIGLASIALLSGTCPRHGPLHLCPVEGRSFEEAHPHLYPTTCRNCLPCW